MRDVAVIGVGRELEGAASRIERQAGAQIHRARDTAFDQFGGLVLVGVDAAEQFRRDVRPRQTAAGIGAEAVAAVELVTDLLETADDNARRLGGEVRRVAGGGEAVDRDAGDALQRFSDRLIRKAPRSAAVIESTIVSALRLMS